MMPDASHGKTTNSEMDDHMAPLVLDLVAVFSLLQEDVYGLLNQAVEEGWTPDVLMSKIEELFQ